MAGDSGSRFWRGFKAALAFAGASILPAVGYMDPGNWATSLAAGASFRYSLLSIILLSNVIAIILQSLCVKLGLVTGKDLAEVCAAYFSTIPRIALWILAELAIIATDLAELIGSAIALNLLVGLPLPWGVALTSADVLIILIGWRKGTQRLFEVAIGLLILGVLVCFIILLSFAKPDWADVFAGYVPRAEIFSDPNMMYVAMGILGATVMPHNLFLHSHLVINRTATSLSIPLKDQMKRTRAFFSTICGSSNCVDKSVDETNSSPAAAESPEARVEIVANDFKFSMLAALRLYTIDTVAALSIALCINSAILIVAAASFYSLGIQVSSIQEAFYFMKETLGAGAAITFALALFFSGQSSVITGTMAGQIVAAGFLGKDSRLVLAMKPWMRRLATRLLAVIPALCAALIGGEQAINKMLIGSQVALSIQLPFAVWPLVLFTSSRAIMKVWNDGTGRGWKRVKSPNGPRRHRQSEDEEMLRDEWDDDDTVINDGIELDSPADAAVDDVHLEEVPPPQGEFGEHAPSSSNSEAKPASLTDGVSVKEPEEEAHTVEVLPGRQKYHLDYRFANNWVLTIVGVLLALILTGLNLWLIVQVARGGISH